MSTARNIEIAANLGEAGGVVESADYGGMFGSNFQFDWFDWLMKNTGTYLFSGALVALIIKFAATIYQYIRNPNRETVRPNEKPRNLNRSIYVKTSLVWEIIKTVLVGTALVGAIAAAVTFAVATPMLFLVAMAGDALVNFGLFLWNAGKMALAHFQLRNKNDPLSRAKLAKIDAEAKANMKAHGLGTIIGLAVTAAVAVIFLFPQIGLGAIGAAAITIGAIKVTVAMIVGVTAGTALVVPLIPSVIKFTKWAVSGLANAIKNAVTKGKAPANQNKKEVEEVKQDKKEEIEQQQQQQKQPLLKKLTQAEEDKKALIAHLAVPGNAITDIDLKLETVVSPGPCREILIDHIEDKATAEQTLRHMLEKKINQLTKDIKGDWNSDLVSLRQKEREHKLMAMVLLMAKLGGIANDLNQFTKHLDRYDYFTNRAIYNEAFNMCDLDLQSLIKRIEETLPGLDVSLFSRQSDTRNMLEAVRHYADKFPEPRVEVAHTM